MGDNIREYEYEYHKALVTAIDNAAIAFATVYKDHYDIASKDAESVEKFLEYFLNSLKIGMVYHHKKLMYGEPES